MSSYLSLTQSLITAPPSRMHLKGAKKVEYAIQCANKLFGSIELPSVVVAGTKGKGSTCAVIESALRSSGLKTGLFTSPHLETPRERIKINGKCIEPDEYVDAYEMVKKGLESNNMCMPPFFGLHTLMSAHVFKERKVDVAVIECGIGGRFDWTKIYSPMTTAITHLEYDHTKVLGNTAEMITWHKAGILDEKSEAFTVPQTPSFMEPLERYAKQQNCKLNIVEPFWKGKMGLNGPTAQENTALGIAAAKSIAKQLNVYLKEEKGAEGSEIFGRYQIYNKDGIQWMLDGAHTKESVQSCCSWYFGLNRNSSNDVLISTLTKGRDIKMLLPILSRKFKKMIFIAKDKNAAKELGFEHANSVEEALKIAKESKPNGVLVTGSMRLVGDTLRLLQFPIQ